jgi:hypothetical protein
VAGWHTIFYLWRPYLTDPDDDMLLSINQPVSTALAEKISAIVCSRSLRQRSSTDFAIKMAR